MSCLSGNIRVVDTPLNGVFESVGASIVGILHSNSVSAKMNPVGDTLQGSIAVDVGVYGLIRVICSAIPLYEIRLEQDAIAFRYGDIDITKTIKLTANNSWRIDDAKGYEVYPRQGKAGTYEISVRPTYINEGVDTEENIEVICGDKTATIAVTHEGKRQPYGVVGGGVYRVKDGGRYLVLKSNI